MSDTLADNLIPLKLEYMHNLLINAGLPVLGVRLNKTIDWEAGHPTNDEEATANAILAGVDLENFTDVDGDDFKSKYQDALTRLDQIINASNPTQAQVVAGMQDMARYQRAMMKLMYRIYRQ